MDNDGVSPVAYARQIDKVKPSKQDEPFFLQCREVVQALEKEMQKTNILVPEE